MSLRDGKYRRVVRRDGHDVWQTLTREDARLVCRSTPSMHVEVSFSIMEIQCNPNVAGDLNFSYSNSLRRKNDLKAEGIECHWRASSLASARYF
jgi:hypothetical protein